MLATLTVLLASTAAGSGRAAAEVTQPLTVLAPGQVGEFRTLLPINVVFVGYEQGTGAQQVEVDRFLSGLARTSFSTVRSGLLAGVQRNTQNSFVLDYRPRFTDAAFDDAFFGHLVSTGTPRMTRWQEAYNGQAARRLDVVDPIAVDAVETERWLGDNAGPRLGLDVRIPTIFLINWYGRADFRFHVYVKTGDPDVDTGYDAGVEDSRALIAWGGTAADDASHGTGSVRRIWFHDLSAGPDFTTANYDITSRDVDGDGWVDYRLPPVWEYGSSSGYRPFDDLSGDLSKVVRFAATDLLLAPSPLYNPAISPPLLPSALSLDVIRLLQEGKARTPLSTGDVLARVGRLQPWSTFSSTEREVPYEGRVQAVQECWATALMDPFLVGRSCYGDRGTRYFAYADFYPQPVRNVAYFDMFFYVSDHLLSRTAGTADHSIPSLLFDLRDGAIAPLGGYAGENAYDVEYTQAFTLTYTLPRLLQFGRGPTATMTHEVGHHLGLSHPIDGLDSESLTFVAPYGDQHFVRVAGESSTVMSYLNVERDFSQFDQDAMGRWMTSAYLNQANQVLAQLFSSPRARRVEGLVQAADEHALSAVMAYFDMDFRDAAVAAKRAYTGVVEAAAAINVTIEPQAAPADAKSHSTESFFADPVPPDFVLARPRGGSQLAGVPGAPPPVAATRSWTNLP